MYDFPSGDLDLCSYIVTARLPRMAASHVAGSVMSAKYFLLSNPTHTLPGTLSVKQAHVTSSGQWNMNRSDTYQFLPEEVNFPRFIPQGIPFSEAVTETVCSTMCSCYMESGSACVWVLLIQVGPVWWERVNLCYVKRLTFCGVYWSIS